MRIQIVSEKDVIDAFSSAAQASGQNVMPADSRVDRTEFAFGLGEISAVVTIVAFALQLAQLIHSISRTIPAQDEKVLRLKSSYGVVTISLNQDTSLEQIEKLLLALEASRE
ncbi:MAG: hypothetical protein RR619_04575 [Raoultibacter sp.]